MIAFVQGPRCTNDARTFLGEQACDFLADAPAGAGDDGDTAVQLAHAASSISVELAYSAAAARARIPSHSGASPPSCGVGRVQRGCASENFRIGPRCRSGPLFGWLSMRIASSSA